MVFSKLDSATWSDYRNIFTEIFNHKLQDTTDNETWKGIMYLFTLRNQLAHGNPLDMLFDQDTELYDSFDDKLDKVFGYLKEKKLVNPNRFEDIISDTTADHFYETANKFLKDIVKCLREKHNLKINPLINSNYG